MTEEEIKSQIAELRNTLRKTRAARMSKPPADVILDLDMIKKNREVAKKIMNDADAMEKSVILAQAKLGVPQGKISAWTGRSLPTIAKIVRSAGFSFTCGRPRKLESK